MALFLYSLMVLFMFKGLTMDSESLELDDSADFIIRLSLSLFAPVIFGLMIVLSDEQLDRLFNNFD